MKIINKTNSYKGIVLAGGLGTRMYPSSLSYSKHLIPVFDKPMIYYPLSVMMIAGILEIAIIVNPIDLENFKRLLGDGSKFGISLNYIAQEDPNGIPEGLILAESFLEGYKSAVILGDNIFYGYGFSSLLSKTMSENNGVSTFGYSVSDPKSYGILELDNYGNPREIIEKPQSSMSDIAITGLYFFDEDAPAKAKQLTPSSRNELEISELNNIYIKENRFNYQHLGRGFTWLDAGTYNSLIQASNFIQALQERQGNYVACLEEIGFRNGWLSREQLVDQAQNFKNSDYGNYLIRLCQENENS
jgi:glucose-1-phosphate thymidylyltransferase